MHDFPFRISCYPLFLAFQIQYILYFPSGSYAMPFPEIHRIPSPHVSTCPISPPKHQSPPSTLLSYESHSPLTRASITPLLPLRDRYLQAAQDATSLQWVGDVS